MIDKKFRIIFLQISLTNVRYQKRTFECQVSDETDPNQLGFTWLARASLATVNVFATLGLYLGFHAMLRICQVPACKMEPQVSILFDKNHTPTHPTTASVGNPS